jgi:hypothetical protein
MVVKKLVVVVGCFASTAWFYQVLHRATVALSTEVRLQSLGHPVIARTTAIVTMAAKKKSDCTGMVTRGLPEPYRGLGTMVREGGVE